MRLAKTSILSFLISSQQWHQKAKAACPNHCSSNGICGLNSVCDCFNGYTGGDCSLRSCPTGMAWSDYATSDDTAHALAECSNRGHCNRLTGLCECEGNGLIFEGVACERLRCPGNCNNRGRCVSLQTLAWMQDPGAVHADCSESAICSDGPCTIADYDACQEVFSYTNPWDAQKIQGCLCDTGFEGFDCSVRTCMVGDDPLTTGQVDEIQEIGCRADGGTFVLSFRDVTSSTIAWDASAADVVAALSALSSIPDFGTGSAISVSFSAGPTACQSNIANVMSITFSQLFGDLPLMIPDGSNLEHSGATFPLVTSQESQAGNRESERCSNRGYCSPLTGFCLCEENWHPSDGENGPGLRDDCGYEAIAASACPGAPECSGHGTCSGSPQYRCDCAIGRSGADCSLFTCPHGESWFSFPSADDTAHEMAECSDMGICDRDTGLCHCSYGFEGSACEVMSCPGKVDTLECSGNGLCLTLAQLAKDYNSHDGSSVSFTYGLIPNDPLTWDRDKIKGCHCSQGWEGYDCSLRSCPKGDDPNTRLQDNEVQTITCTLTNPSDTLTVELLGDSFTIGVQETLADFVSALESLNSVARVRGYYTDPLIYVGAPALAADALHLCRATPDADWSVEFESPTGDVPLMSFTSALSGVTLNVVETTKGTKEYSECSNRGLCNYSTGTCECFNGFASSDGQGNEGSFDDCGYRSPYFPI